MLKLDVKDKKILYYLSSDSQISDSQLGKKISLGKNSARYRIERMQKEGIITKFTTSMHLGAIGLDTFCLLLKFKEDIYEKNEILSYIKNHELANWAVSLSGDWDIFCEFVYSELFESKKIIEKIIQDLAPKVLTYQIFFSYEAIKVEHLVADIYKDLDLEELPVKSRTKNKIKLDDEDKIILNLLAKDSSISYVKLASQSGLSFDSVRYRTKQLKKSSVIISFFPEICLEKLGYTQYLFTLEIKEPAEDKVNSLKQLIRANTNITYAFFDLITLKLVFVCAFKSSQDLDSLARNIRKDYSEILESQTYFVIREQLLFNIFPNGLVKKGAPSDKKLVEDKNKSNSEFST